MNNQHVMECANNINKDIRTELGNAPDLVSNLDSSADLKKHWDTFIAKHYEAVDKKSQEWLDGAISKPLEAIPGKITELKELSADLKEKWDKTHPDYKKYSEEKTKEYKEKEKIKDEKKTALKKVEDELKALKDKKGVSDKEKTDKAKESYDARVEYHTADTAIRMMFVNPVNDMIKNLEGDKKILEGYEGKVAGLSLPKLKTT